jgi:hypothetical protein
MRDALSPLLNLIVYCSFGMCHKNIRRSLEKCGSYLRKGRFNAGLLLDQSSRYVDVMLHTGCFASVHYSCFIFFVSNLYL